MSYPDGMPWELDERRSAERDAPEWPHARDCLCRQCGWDELTNEERSQVRRTRGRA